MGDTDEWLQLERLLAKASASRFHLSQAEFATFDGWWALSAPARDKRKSLATETHAEIREAFVRLAAIVNDGAVYKAEVGSDTSPACPRRAGS